MSEVIETKVVCKQKNRYIGWPTIVCAPDGTLHAVFSGDRESHICSGFGKSYITSSKDEGKTWSEPAVVNDTPLDDRDTGLCVMPDGTLIISWFTSYYYRSYEVMHAGYTETKKFGNHAIKPWAEWEKKLERATPDELDKWSPYISRASEKDIEKWSNAFVEMGCKSSVDYDERFPANTRRLGYWTRRSNDGGKTWDAATLSPFCCPHGPNVMSGDKLIYIGQDIAWSGNLGVCVSPDKGLTWKTRSIIKADVSEGDVAARLCEPHVVETPSGKLVGVARYQAAIPGEERFVWQFESEDGGYNWTAPRPTKLNGYPPHLLRTSDGRLLASMSVRHEPYGHRFCFSNDEGKTWDVDNELFLNDAPDGDLGYPATAEVKPGEFVSVYYIKEAPKEKTCLMMTRWKG